jgi:hypothetical protein
MKVTIEIIGQAMRMRNGKDGSDSNVRLYAAYDFSEGFSYEDACGP